MNWNIKNTLLSLSLVILAACTSNKAEEKDSSNSSIITVKTSRVKQVEYAEEVRATGRLAYNNEYKMSFKTGGVIDAIYVKEGQKVMAGKLLATLKLDEIETKTSQADISVQKAKRDYDRAKALYADSVATLEQLQNAESQLLNAQQNLKAAQFNQNLSKIFAPANGVIQKILVNENEITGAGNPIIVFGAENKGKVLIVNISDADVVKLETDDKATLNFDAFPETNFGGTVIEIAGMASPATGTYEVKILVNDTNNKLKPGFIGSAIITSSNVNQWMEIPVEALVQADKKNGLVYKFENGLAVKQEVYIAKILNRKLLISAGLNNGDKIIVEGQDKISGDNSSVTTIN